MSKELLNETNQLFSIAVVYSIIKKLVTPFNETQAFKLGIIDENGKVLRKRSTLKTAQERQAYTLLDTLVFNLKKLLEKIPGGKSKLMTFAAALWLVKEAYNYEHYTLNEDLFEEDFNEYLFEYEKGISPEDIKTFSDIVEEIANVTGPAVATDIPFKPKVKTKPEDLTKSFLKMYEESKGIKKDPKIFDVLKRRKNVQ